MKFFPKLMTREKLVQAKREFMISGLMFIIGCSGWYVVLQDYADFNWFLIIFFLMTLGGVYLFGQAIVGPLMDFTVGHAAFVIGFSMFILGGLLVSGYQLLTAP